MLAVNQQSEITNRPFELQPTNFEQAIKYAEIISRSNFVPKEYRDKPGDVLIVIQMGQEIGLKPLQSLQNISCINGRPSMWGDAVLGLVRASGLLEYIKEYREKKVGHCHVLRKGDKHEIHTTYSLDDAKRAGLLNKDNWTKYEDRMLQMRARSFALRDGFPDVLKGIICREEAEDYPEEKSINPEENKVAVLKSIVVGAEKEVKELPAEKIPLQTEEVKNLTVEYYSTLIKDCKESQELLKIAQDIATNFKGTPEQQSDLRNKFSIRRDEFKALLKNELPPENQKATPEKVFEREISEMDASWEEYQKEDK